MLTESHDEEQIIASGGFHHHPLDTTINQMIGQLGQRPGHRR